MRARSEAKAKLVGSLPPLRKGCDRGGAVVVGHAESTNTGAAIEPNFAQAASVSVSTNDVL